MANLIFLLTWFLVIQKVLPEIKGYDFSSAKVQQQKLPAELAEASGLAFTPDGRLFCHDDEQGIIYQIDYRTGKIVKRFYLGKWVTYRGDLEGIAIKRDTIFVVNSNGTILRFLEGADKKTVSYETIKTPLSSRHNVEGLAYDPVTDCLLLACKGDAGKEYKDYKAVYQFSLKTYTLHPKPLFLLPLKEITKSTDRKEFNPSAIERHPRTGHFFILAFNGYALVEIDPKGELVGASSLPKSVNPQPEGLAIAPDGTAVICNDERGKRAHLSIYSPRN